MIQSLPKGHIGFVLYEDVVIRSVAPGRQEEELQGLLRVKHIAHVKRCLSYLLVKENI